MGRKRNTEYHQRFHDLMSKIESHGVNLSDLKQRQNLARSIVTVLPQFPAAWSLQSKSKKSQYARVMHTLNAVVNGRQHTFNKATEAAVRAGLAYHTARDEIETESILVKPKNSKQSHAARVGDELLPLRQPVEPVKELVDDRPSFTVRERLLIAWMSKDEQAFLTAVKEVI